MGSIIEMFRPKAENREWYSVLEEIGWGGSSSSGVSVNTESALTYAAVWAAVRVLSEGASMLPLILYRRLPGGGKERATDHFLYSLLHDSPNYYQTSMEFRETEMLHLLTWGNSYARMIGNNGFTEQLELLHPSGMEQIRKSGGQVIYSYRYPDGRPAEFSDQEIMQLRGLSGDGLWGYSPIRMHREAIGLGLGTQDFGAKFFGQGANMGGFLEIPGSLSDPAYERLKKQFAAENAGLANAHKVKILEEGLQYKPRVIPPDDAQFLETRKFQIAEIARIFRVPPHMLADLDRATFSNIEQQSLEFVMFSLAPWLVRIEQAIARQLLTAQERKVYFVEHLVDALLRGDTLSRYQAYKTGIEAGFLTRNEPRILENLNPDPDLDKFLIPLNMSEVGAEPPAQEPQPPDNSGSRSTRSLYTVEKRARAKSRNGIAAAQAAVLEDATGRIVKREVQDVKRAIGKLLVNQDDPRAFVLWLEDFYRDTHSKYMVRAMKPPLAAIAELVRQSVAEELGVDVPEITEFLKSYLDVLTARWSTANQLELVGIVRETDPEELIAALEARLDDWAETEPGKMARRESRRSVNAFARAAMLGAGVTKLQWVTFGKNCPYCDSLNGAIVGIEESFVAAGDYHPDGTDTPLKVRGAKFHPPIHDGCDCQIVAA